MSESACLSQIQSDIQLHWDIDCCIIRDNNILHTLNLRAFPHEFSSTVVYSKDLSQRQYFDGLVNKQSIFG